MLFLFCNVFFWSAFLDRNLPCSLLIRGKILIRGGNVSCSGELSSGTWPCYLPGVPQPRAAGARCRGRARGDREQAGQRGAADICCCASSTHVCCTVAAELVPGPSSCHLKSNKCFAVEQMERRIDPLIYLHVCVYKDKVHTKIQSGKRKNKKGLKYPGYPVCTTAEKINWVFQLV